MPPDTIARIFYLVFTQACVGGLVLLPITPRKSIDARFFRVMGATFFLAILLGLWARWAGERDDSNPWRAREWTLLWTFIVALFLYTVTIIPDLRPLSVAAWGVGCVAGIALVIVSALGEPSAGETNWHTVSLVLNFLIATLMLGSVTNGMLFGHWYLVDPHMSLEPIKKLIALFGISLIAAVGLLIANALTLDTTRLLGAEHSFHALLFWMRMLFGTASSMMLAFLTWRCLILGPGTTKYHATRAATGLLYVAMLTAFSGELLGRFLLITTKVPV